MIRRSPTHRTKAISQTLPRTKDSSRQGPLGRSRTTMDSAPSKPSSQARTEQFAAFKKVSSTPKAAGGRGNRARRAIVTQPGALRRFPAAEAQILRLALQPHVESEAAPDRPIFVDEAQTKQSRGARNKPIVRIRALGRDLLRRSYRPRPRTLTPTSPATTRIFSHHSDCAGVRRPARAWRRSRRSTLKRQAANPSSLRQNYGTTYDFSKSELLPHGRFSSVRVQTPSEKVLSTVLR